MRNKIINLEEINQNLRINFDDTIKGLESKVDQEKEKIYESVMNDFRSEISRKNEKISDLEKVSMSQQEKYGKFVEEKNMKELQKMISEMRVKLDMKNQSIES